MIPHSDKCRSATIRGDGFSHYIGPVNPHPEIADLRLVVFAEGAMGAGRNGFLCTGLARIKAGSVLLGADGGTMSRNHTGAVSTAGRR